MTDMSATAVSCVVCCRSAIPFNLMTIDSLGRKWTLGLNFVGAGLFCFLAQICSSHTVILTVTLFGVRSFISGVFRIIYVYTSEVSLGSNVGLCTSEPAYKIILLALNPLTPLYPYGKS